MMEKSKTKLSDILGDEAQNIGEHLKKRIEEHITILDDCISDLKNAIVQNKAATETQEFQLEKELLDCQTKLLESNDTGQKLRSQITEAETRLSDTRKNYEDLQTEHSRCVTTVQTLEGSLQVSEQEKKALSDLLEKKDEGTARHNDEMRALTVKITEANTAKFEALLKVEAVQVQEMNWQYQRKRLEQEKDLLAKQVAVLNQEVGEKSQEILRLRKECTTQSLELRADMEQRTDEFHMAQKQVADLKGLLADRDAKFETLAKRLNEAEQMHLQAEEHFQREIKAQIKLSDLYKKSSDDAEKRVDELLGTVEDMHKLLKETADSHLQLEQKMNELQEEFDSTLNEKESTVSNLKKELEHANQLLVKSKALGFSDDGVEMMFPTAAATSKALKSGSTLTQIYSEYVKSLEELQNEKQEKQKLNQQLQHILAEIEDKMPAVKRRFQEYQTALETISCLRSQLAVSITDQEKLQAKSDDAFRMTGFLQRENERLKQASTDLSQQVRVLLKELEEARGNHVPMDDSQEQQISSSDEKRAENVITSRLVTFRSIEELQENNQRLISVVRELSEQQEEHEKSSNETRTAELNTQLEEAMGQLDELRRERTRQAELVESIVQQRDTYRTLLSQYQTISPLRTVNPLLSSTPQQAASRVSFEESKLQESLKEAKTDFDTYKREMAENVRMLNEQLDKFRDEASDLKIQNARLSSQLSYAQERHETVRLNLETYKDEVNILREMNQKFSTSITQHQKTIAVLRQDLISTQEKLSKAEVTVQNLQAEKELLKNSEMRLLHDKDSMHNEQKTHAHMMANLQAVQNNLERLEVESRLLMNSQLQKANDELSFLRKKLESEEERYKSAVVIWEKRVEELQEKLSSDREKAVKTQDELVDAYARVHEHSRTISELEAKLAAAPVKPAAVIPASSPSQTQAQKAEEGRGILIKNLQGKINELNSEVQALRGSMSVCQKSLEQFRTLSSDLEKRLMDETEASKEFRETTEKAAEEKNAQLEALQRYLEEAENRNNQLVSDMDASSQKIKALEARVSELETALESAEGNVEDARKIEAQARQDCQKQMQMMVEAQEQYQRELMLHATAVEALTKLKERVGSIDEELSAVKQVNLTLESNLADSRRSWRDQENLLKQEATNVHEKCEELETQNASLLQQLELMSSQMAAIKTKDWSNVPGLEESAQNAEYTVQVVRYLRKEKGIAMAKSEAAEAELARLKVNLDFAERQLAETRAELAVERDKAQVATATESQHRALLQKVEMMNITTESNLMLRNQKESLDRRTVELEQQIQKLECRLAPMEKESRELNSKIDVLGAENNALRSEIKRWQTRCNHLLEQSRKTDPEDFKRLQEENGKLKKELANLAENLGSRDAELGQMGTTLANAQRDLESAKNAAQASKQNAETAKKELDTTKHELAEQQKTSLQVKKIARKYKTQYDELKAQFTELEGRSATAAVESAAARQQGREEVQQELKDAEEQLKKKTEEVEKTKEEFEKTTKEALEGKAKVEEQLERSRKLMLQAKKRIAMLTAERDKSKKDLETMAKDLEANNTQMESIRQAAEEDDLRQNTIKSQLESKIGKLEKELTNCKERDDLLQKKVDELNQKVAQKRKQVTTQSTTIERSNVSISEPLTANIRPLTPPMVTSGSGGTLRHAQHPSTPSSRLPPTASIRPMAIGASTSAATGHQAATRMAAVPPTTANIPTSTDAEVPSTPVTTAHILPTVPQAAVQPTPVVPPTIITSPEQTTSTVIEPNVDTEVRAGSESILVAAVSARTFQSRTTEHSDDSRSATESEEVTTCLATTSPQTQVVTPTVKRTREETESPREADAVEGGSTSAVSPQLKRIRMVSEASQTIERATVVTSSSVMEQPEGPSSKSADEPVVPERPGVIVTPEPQPIAQHESSQPEPEPEDDTVPQPDITPFEESESPSEQETSEEFSCEKDSPAKPPSASDETIVETEEQRLEEEDDEEYDEGMDDESYEEEHMQEVRFSQEEDEDDMVTFDGDGEEMAEPQTEEVEIIDEDDSQMDAQETAAVPSSAQDADSAMSRNIQVGVVPTEMSEGNLQGVPTTLGHHHGTRPLLPRVPGRSERLPSGQTAGFEDGDDSIVPSTPTLFVPRRGDGFAEAISSPHVPQGRFVFSNAAGDQQGLSQLASQGALGVDDTRMDLSQFDEGCGRSVPSTPLQVSPPAEVGRGIELGEVSMTPEATRHEGNVPTITVTSEEDPGSGVQEEEASGSGDKSDPTVEEPETPEESVEKAESTEEKSSSGLVIVDITSLAETEKEESEDNPTVTDPDDSQQEAEASESGPGKGTGQRKPIIWERAGSSGSGATASASTPAPTGQFPSPPPRSSSRGAAAQPRGRRIRVRGTTTAFAQRGGWAGYWRGRGGAGRGNQH